MGDQILVLVPACAAFLVVHLGAGSGFQKAHQRHDQYRHGELAKHSPVQRARPIEVRQAARQCSHHGAAMRCVADGRTERRRCAHDHDHRWKPGPTLLGHHQQGQTPESKGRPGAIHCSVGGRLQPLKKALMQAQQRRQLREQDQKRSSLCKAAEHGRGDHLHDPAKARHAHHHLQAARQNRHPGGKRHPLRAARLRQTGEGSPDQQTG